MNKTVLFDLPDYTVEYWEFDEEDIEDGSNYPEAYYILNKETGHAEFSADQLPATMEVAAKLQQALPVMRKVLLELQAKPDDSSPGGNVFTFPVTRGSKDN